MRLGSQWSRCRQLVDWRRILTIVQPATLIRWHRKGYRLFWRLNSRPRGRPPVPADVQHLMREMASANRPWGEERIAAELLVTLGLHLSPRTVRRYLPTSQGRPRTGAPSSQWSTFVRNHATAVFGV